MPTRFNKNWSGRPLRDIQKAFLEHYDGHCFVSCGRVYVKLEKYIVDAVTGTLYALNGHSLSQDAGLFVDVNDRNSDPKFVANFVKENY